MSRHTSTKHPERAAKSGRVLHILKYYRPAFTGEGVFLERSSNLMQMISPEVRHDLLVTTTPRPDAQPRLCTTLSNVFYLTTEKLPPWRHEIALLAWFVRNLHRYDTVHVRTHADWYFLSYVLSKLMGRKLILSATLDDSVPVLINHYRPQWRGIARSMLRLFDAHVTISPKLRDEDETVVQPGRCHLIPCGIDFPPDDPDSGLRIRAQYGIPADAMVLIFVGGLCARKDPAFLVSHMPELLQARPDCYLLLVGPELEPDYVAELRETVARLNLTDRVVFVGEVPNAHPYFEASDIMTFASRLEGLGTVVPEAMAHARPVVVRHLPGVNDTFVRHGETGFLFNNGAEYVRFITPLLTDPAQRNALGARGRALVRTEFDMQAVARKYLTLYGFPPADPPIPLDTNLTGLRTVASIVDPRFHVPANLDRLEKPVLVTMIDAEEAFDWGQPFCREQTDVASMRYQDKAHRIFERYKVVPTYMVDYPVATQDGGRGPLREYLQSGACDIGAQLHPWVSPPFSEKVSIENSFPGNLPPWLEYEKLRLLTEAIESELGVRPRVYRAGRYGAGARTADILRSLGYLADSSVMPSWDFSGQGGPNYAALSAGPRWVDGGQTLLELPCSAAIVGRWAKSTLLSRSLYTPLAENAGLPSMTAHLGLMERIKLTPEGIRIGEAKRLVRHMRQAGHKVFVMTYHTPSLVPGNTPYVRNQADLDGLLRWLDEFYSFFNQEIGGTSGTWRQVRDAAAAALLPATPHGPVAHVHPDGGNAGPFGWERAVYI